MGSDKTGFTSEIAVEGQQCMRKATRAQLGHEHGKNLKYPPSSATIVLSSVTLHTYRRKFDKQNLVLINMHEAGETNLLPIACYNKILYILNNVILGLSYKNRSLTLAKSLMEVAILNGKPNHRFKT